MSAPVLEVKNLHVTIGDKEVISGLSLKINQGDILVLLGQNGCGKTSLLMSIMGFSNYKVTKGDILFEGNSIIGLSIDQRAKLGIGMLFQRPPTVRGVKLRQIIEIVSKGKDFDLKQKAQDLDMGNFLDRDINLGFSGGEMKRSELLQLVAQDPKLVLFDEPESGVDLENVGLMGKIMNDFLKQSGKCGLIITHTGHILEHVKTDLGCVLADSKLHCLKNPKQIIEDIRKFGYEKCAKCKG